LVVGGWWLVVVVVVVVVGFLLCVITRVIRRKIIMPWRRSISIIFFTKGVRIPFSPLIKVSLPQKLIFKY